MVLMKKKAFLGHKKGFTLVELLVVIAILGIFATIASLSVVGITERSRKRAVETAMTSYWESTNNYFYQLNAGFGGSPNLTQAQLRIGNNVATISTQDASSLPNGHVYIQYAVNAKKPKYTITKITYNYKGKYYYTTDGTNVVGPLDKIS